MIVKESSSPVDIDADILALTFFEDERPLRGHAGMVDWRMNGELSRMIVNGSVSGREGEPLLMSTDSRIPSPRILLFGLGDSKLFEPKRFQGLLTAFVRTVSKLNLSRLAVSIPGSSLFSVENMAGAVKAEFSKAGLPDDAEIIIIK